MTRPRPVLTAGGIAGLVTSIAGVVTFLGVPDVADKLSTQAQTIGIVAAVLLGLFHVGAAVVAQTKVTPNSDPRDAAGRPLTPDTGPRPGIEPAASPVGGPAISLEPFGV
jgi:hypothetical protein